MAEIDPGLEGVTVAETELSRVDGAGGELAIGGYPVDLLAGNATYEESLYLLFRGRLPTESELAEFRADLAARRGVGDEVRAVLGRAAREDRSAMEALRMGLAVADLDAGGDDPRTAARRVVAVTPTLVATYWGYRTGRGPPSPRADRRRAANYYAMLTGGEPTAPEVRALETYLNALVDHGLNASTFAARVVASTGSDPVSAATAAVGALKGPRHGRLESVADLLAAVRRAEDPEECLRDRLSGPGPVPGFGHPVYRGRDPRAAVLEAAAERYHEAAGDPDSFETVRSAEEAALDVLGGPGSGPATNANFYAAALLRDVGVPRDLLTATFAVSRVGGWMAHCLERSDGDRLVRPASRYVGDTDRTWTPVEDRYVAGDAVVERPLRSATVEPIAETLATLAEPTRLELLFALYDADGPIAYSTLREATGIDDKGRFNYHLRKLRGNVVVDRGEGYVLTDAGRSLLDAVLTDDRLLERRSG